MRTTLQIDDDLYRAAKQTAAASGRTLTAVVEDALRQALSLRSQPADVGKFELPVLHLGKTLPGVDLDNTAALLDLMDADDDSV